MKGKLCTLVVVCSAPFVMAQNLDDGATASWNEIYNTTINDSDFQSVSDFNTANQNETGTFNLSGGAFQATAWGQATALTELKAFAHTAITTTGTGLTAGPDRINSAASAFIGEKWVTSSATLENGDTFSSVVDINWDGSLVVNVPGHNPNLGVPNFNEVGVSVDVSVYQINDQEEFGEPLPVFSYVSNSLVLRADGTSFGTTDFVDAASVFGVSVDVFDPTALDPYSPIGSQDLVLDVQATAGLPNGAVGFDIDLGGELEFTAIMGQSYIVNYGLSVYSNVTGALGSATADFTNTGSVSLLPESPGTGTFAIIPEPGSLTLAGLCVLGGLVACLRTRRK